MKIDNRVRVYDYYCRLVGEKTFDELVECRFAGKERQFRPLANPPAKIKVEKKAAYIPPSLRKGLQKEEVEWKSAHIVKAPAPGKTERAEEIKRELQEVEDLKRRLDSGEVIPGAIYKIKRAELLQKELEHLGCAEHG